MEEFVNCDEEFQSMTWPSLKIQTQLFCFMPYVFVFWLCTSFHVATTCFKLRAIDCAAHL